MITEMRGDEFDGLSDDELLAELEREDDDFLADHRERRMDELKHEINKLQYMKENRHGTYDTIRSEKEVLSITTSTKCCVVHFAHKDFRRCQLMDKHLSALAPKFFRTRFVRIDVDDAPFLVERLKIKVLPCVVPFIDGVSVDRLVGFEAVGNSDNVPTSAIEKWLLQTKAIEEDRPSTKKSIFGYPAKSSSDDEDSDY